MPLIKCPECKKKVSDQCGNCPRCGYPIEKVAANIEPKPEKTLKEENIEPAKKKGKEREKKPINKKLLIVIIAITFVLLSVCCVLGYNALLPRINATSAFNSAVESVEQKNIELQAAIKKSEQLIAKNLPLLDETHIPKLENAISDTKAAKVTDFERPSKVEDIVSRTAELNAVDYTSVLANLSDKHNALEINAKRYQLVNVPTEAYVIQRLKTISDITGISAVTEDHDPNGNLNKLGGYTSTVYFSHKNLKLDKSIYGKTLIDQGTDAGGAIEVYTCVEDAIKRRDYLARFDGTVTASGTHTVIGTVLVRTSDKLTASQQKAFEAKLIAALTYIEEVDSKKETPTLSPTSSKTSSTVSTSKKATQQNTTSKTVKSQKEKAIEAIKTHLNSNKNTIITWYDLDAHLTQLGFDDSARQYALDNTSGYYRGEAVENEQARVKLLFSYGYTREAIIDWYVKDMDYTEAEAEALVDSCIE